METWLVPVRSLGATTKAIVIVALSLLALFGCAYAPKPCLLFTDDRVMLAQPECDYERDVMANFIERNRLRGSDHWIAEDWRDYHDLVKFLDTHGTRISPYRELR